jgi:hypothetical protein
VEKDRGQIELSLWEYTDDLGNRRRSTWRMTEETTQAYREAAKVEGTLEQRRSIGSTSAWQNGRK